MGDPEVLPVVALLTRDNGRSDVGASASGFASLPVAVGDERTVKVNGKFFRGVVTLLRSFDGNGNRLVDLRLIRREPTNVEERR